MKNRRDFLKIAGVATVGLFGIVLSSITNAEERKRGGSATAPKAELVDENSSQAKVLNYKNDRAKISDSKLKTERQGLVFDKQSCSNCSLYQGKPGEKSGGCAVFPGKQVASTGWCTSWMKKV